jgi:hypothetical protein
MTSKTSGTAHLPVSLGEPLAGVKPIRADNVDRHIGAEPEAVLTAREEQHGTAQSGHVAQEGLGCGIDQDTPTVRMMRDPLW